MCRMDVALIEQASRLLLQATPPGSGVILFGSRARGDAHPDSDVDFLVIEPELSDTYGETVRLQEVIRPLRLPADVLVTSRAQFDYWRQTPNTVYFQADREGTHYGPIG